MDERQEFSKGDKVRVVRGDGFTHSVPYLITRVGKQFVQTEDGRQWHRESGEWISGWFGNKPEKWPYPTIEKVDG